MKEPLVSAILPTADRRDLLPLALACFRAQDWPRRELVVIDDGEDMIADVVRAAGLEHVIYHRMTHRHRIGTKLNFGITTARGDILLRWDDDDWYAPGRITDQVHRLLETGKSVTGYNTMVFWDQCRREASKYTGPPTYALGTTLCFHRRYWAAHPFLDSSYGEDGEFIKCAQQALPAPDIIAVPADGMAIARIHTRNCANPSGPRSWPKAEPSEIPAAFFRDLEDVNRAN